MTNQARQPAGVPTGGQFAPSVHQESDLKLSPPVPTASDLADYLNNFDADDPVSLDDIEMFFDHIAEVRTPQTQAQAVVLCRGCGQEIDEAEYLEHDRHCNEDDNRLSYGDLADKAKATAQQIATSWHRWDAIPDSIGRYAFSGEVTPGGFEAWKGLRNEVPGTSEWEGVEDVLDAMGREAEVDGIALDRDSFLKLSGLNPSSEVELDAMWESYRSAAESDPDARVDGWVYRHGREFGAWKVPAPPLGTHIDEKRARSLPPHTIIEANFPDLPGTTRHRLMARDQPKWGSDFDGQARRFTDLTNGTEVFVGGNDSQWKPVKLGGIVVVEHD